eukprot:6190929-Pleurochrysis_carterae.AAC.1
MRKLDPGLFFSPFHASTPSAPPRPPPPRQAQSAGCAKEREARDQKRRLWLDRRAPHRRRRAQDHPAAEEADRL